MIRTEQQVLDFIKFSQTSDWNIKQIISQVYFSSEYDKVGIGKCIKRIKNDVVVQNDVMYKRLTIKTKGGGVFVRDEVAGKEINTKNQYRVSSGQLAVSKIDARNGAFGIVPVEAENAIITGNFWVFDVDTNKVFPQYLVLLLSSDQFTQAWLECSNGSGNRLYLQEEKFLKYKIPLPSIPEQQALLDKYNANMKNAVDAEQRADKMHDCIFHDLSDMLGIVERKAIKLNGLGAIPFSQTEKWGIDFLVSPQTTYNRKFPVCPAGNLCDIGSGGTPSRNHQDYYNGQIPWVKTGEVLDDIIVDTEEKITPKAVKNSSAVLYPVGSLIIAMYGQGKTRGKTAKLGIEATTNQACAVLYNINTGKVLVDYLWFYFQGEYDRIRALAYGNNQPNLNAKIIKTYPIVLPPIHSDNKDDISQEKIVADIQNKKATIKALREEAESLRQRAKKEFEEAVFGEFK